MPSVNAVGNFLIKEDNKRANKHIPTPNPKIKGIRIAGSMSPIASSTTLYFPCNNRIKDPDIPGEIIAHAASIPVAKINNGVSG